MNQMLVMGLSCVNPVRYRGWNGDCPGTDVDVRRARAWADRIPELAYLSVLCDREATVPQGHAKLAQMLRRHAHDDDLTVVFYSGHGAQVRDASGDEADGLDEALCMWDGYWLDDNLAACCREAAAGTVVFVLDCCHSGQEQEQAQVTLSRVLGGTTLSARVIVLAGCEEARSSWGSKAGGEWSWALSKALFPEGAVEGWLNRWVRGRAPRCEAGLSIGEWFDQAAARLEKRQRGQHARQTPVLTMYNCDRNYVWTRRIFA